MKDIDAVYLTQKMIRLDTVNPPGFEHECAEILGSLLGEAGFVNSYHDFSPGRTTLISRYQGTDSSLRPLALTGHLDTVPFGHQPWSKQPLAGEIEGGKLFGRGASDMKSGVAVIVASAISAAGRPGTLKRGLQLILTAGEETGCEGSRHVAMLEGGLEKASALLVAEPTSNYPTIGHRGALWLRGSTEGVTAHGSMPERGVNAIYKASRAITKLADFDFNVKRDPLLGAPSINVGTVRGGMNVNSVPDFAEFSIDIRSIKTKSHPALLNQISSYLQEQGVRLEPFVDLDPVKSEERDPFIQCVYDIAARHTGARPEPKTLPFFTDASILAEALDAPVVIMGPGETALAHQTDEFCFVEKIPEAVTLYSQIIDAWCR